MHIELDGETRATTWSVDSAEGPSFVPMLTILSHPDPSRIGEHLLLRALAIGREVLLSRTEPVFQGPSGENAPYSLSGSPLGGLYLSRQPIRLRPAADPGGIVLDLRTTRTKVKADGDEVEQERVFSPQEITKGVVLKLARKIVLLLHRSMISKGQDAQLPSYDLVGASSAMVRLRQEIRRLASLDVPVLLRGETGTGKELVARALHEGGHRQGRSYVAVNMGVLGPSLAAAALFGVERGAYTGADRKRPGYFHSAQGGTLFLDEIGEAPPEVQVMLLRTLETQEIQPVGSTEFIKVDVRVIAATDARLEEAMAADRFKTPLYHRLAGYTVNLPALRERREDLGQLLYFFLEEELAKLGEPALKNGDPEHPWPSAELVARLALHPWPGNVRELRNVARRLAIAGREEAMPDLEMLLASVSPGSPAIPPEASDPPSPKRRTLRKFTDVEEAELLQALRENRWHLQATAEALNVSRPNLYRLVEACPSVRTANQIPPEEIEIAVAEAAGDLEAAAFELEVSMLGLKRRIKALGLDMG